MTEARQRDQWNHTAAAMALQANLNRDPKKGRALKPADFHPCPEAPKRRTEPPPLKGDIRMLKAVFVDQRPGQEGL